MGEGVGSSCSLVQGRCRCFLEANSLRPVFSLARELLIVCPLQLSPFHLWAAMRIGLAVQNGQTKGTEILDQRKMRWGPSAVKCERVAAESQRGE